MSSTETYTLPFDVWEHIANFLAPKEVLGLLSVNRALFNIAMNKRYRRVSITNPLQFGTSRHLTMLTNPDVAARVHHLHIEPGPICYLQMEHQVMTLRPEQIDPEERARRDAIVASLSTVMGHLNYLMTLCVEIRGPYQEYFAKVNPPFFQIGWKSFRHTLQKLELRVPIESMATVLPDLAGGMVENLEELILDIVRANPSSTESEIIMLETILPFLDAHRHSLKSLTIDAVEKTNLSPILDSVIFPRLTYFKLAQPYFKKSNADYTGVHQFFINHRKNLTSFEIVIGYPAVDEGSPDAIFSQNCFLVPLPSLQNLTIQYNFNDNGVTAAIRDSFMDYVHQFSAHLVFLSLSSRLTGKSARRLLKGFSASTNLRKLQISIFILDTELFTVLTKNLPLLESLSLYYSEFAEEFPKNARLLDISHWQLRRVDLNLGPAHMQWKLKQAKNVIDKCQVALLQALPLVMVFCGLRREDYLSSVAVR